MEVAYEAFWPMLREIRSYCRETKHKVEAFGDPMRRLLGFRTIPDRWTVGRDWTISLSKLSTTANRPDADLDGNPVTPEFEEIRKRYNNLMRFIDGRAIVAEALSVGIHPTQEMVDRIVNQRVGADGCQEVVPS